MIQIKRIGLYLDHQLSSSVVLFLEAGPGVNSKKSTMLL